MGEIFMKFVKITYKNDYDTTDRKGKRPLLRAYEKAGVKSFIEGGNPIVLAVLNKNCLYEMLTNKPLLVKNFEYEEINYEYVRTIIHNAIDNKELRKVYDIISVMFFNEDIDLGFEISDMDEMSRDRNIQFSAYNDDLTDINPYSHDNLNDYTISQVKLYGKKK